MTVVRGLLAVLSVVANMDAAGAECRMTMVSRLAVTPLDGLPTVQAALNQHPATLYFDTGSYTSVLTMQAAHRVGLTVMRGEEFNSLHVNVSGLGGGRSALGVTAREVALGNLHARDYNFIAAPDIVAPPADGLLSIDLISQFDIDLDFPDREIRLFQPVGDCSAPAAFLARPLYVVPLLANGQDRRPRVNVTVGGRQIVALIDTGASRSGMFRRAAQHIGIDAASGPMPGRSQVSGIGPRLVSVRQTRQSLDIGDLTFENMPIDIIDDHGDDDVQLLLGRDLQAKVHLWISYSSHSLIMQFPALPSKGLSAP